MATVLSKLGAVGQRFLAAGLLIGCVPCRPCTFTKPQHGIKRGQLQFPGNNRSSLVSKQ